MEISIRDMELEDVELVKKVAVESWHATYEGLIPRAVQDQFLAQAYNLSMLEKRCQRSPFYVAEWEGKVIGFANYSNVKDDRSVELAAIYLHPDHQRRGAGSKLLQHGIQLLKPQSILIDVESENKLGKSFYEAKGFQAVSEFDDDFDGHLLKTTRMRLSLKDKITG